MKKEINGFIIGFIITAFLFGSPVLADNIIKTIQVKFNAINLEINGKKVDADNILYNGTTYVPIRKVGELLDKNVEYVSKTKTAKITDKPNSTNNSLADFGSIKTSEGTYTGQLYNGMRHGKGTMVFSNKDTYTGTFTLNEMTGRGSYEYYNGDVYDGDFIEGKRDGWGTLTYSNGNIYKGMFTENTITGFGSFYKAFDKSLFVGFFEDNVKYDYGYYKYDNGNYLIVNYDNGNLIGEYTKVENGIYKVYKKVNGQEVFVK